MDSCEIVRNSNEILSRSSYTGGGAGPIQGTGVPSAPRPQSGTRCNGTVSGDAGGVQRPARAPQYLPHLNEPQVVYIPVPVPEYRAGFWDVVKTVAEATPPEGYAEGVRRVAELFSTTES